MPFLERFVVLLRSAAGDKALARALGCRIAHADDYRCAAVRTNDISDGDVLLFDQLGVAIVAAPAQQIERLRKIACISAWQPERTMYAPLSAEAPAQAKAFDETRFTWGLQATHAVSSRYSGRGIRVAVLDTGFDFHHPDFSGRSITAQSFVDGLAAADVLGHGTHCIGTACGPRAPDVPPGYGVAFNAEIFAGKVLNDSGAGTDTSILAGINWAVANQCRVVSLSLGVAVEPGEAYSRIYEAAARRALAAGTLLIAAAGNVSARSLGIVAPVVRPANCPSILAAAAVDSRMTIVDSSCRALGDKGSRIDIAAPGAAIYSSWPMPRRYRTFGGTSMAAPYVAGLAALHLEAAPELTARELWTRLIRTASQLDLPHADAGAGLAQAP